MAQGNAKVGKAKKSAGSQKRKVVRSKTVVKGPKQFSDKRPNLAAREVKAATKAINRKNEALVAAAAVSVGSRFFLGDISEKGKKLVKKQLKDRSKKESRCTKVSDRLKVQLQRLGKGA
jgi:hypothetical protein